MGTVQKWRRALEQAGVQFIDADETGRSGEGVNDDVRQRRRANRRYVRGARGALAETLDAYHEDFPDEFHWAIGAQSPALLYHLMMSIDTACRPPTESKVRGAVRLVDRKPEGSA
jgi:hypothetical protein